MYKTFRDMPILQDALDIAEKIFKLTDILPKKDVVTLKKILINNTLPIPSPLPFMFMLKKG